MMLRRRCRTVKGEAPDGTVAASLPQQHHGYVSVRRDDLETRRFRKQLGARIKEARESVGITTVAELARKVDADRGTIARWEEGKGAPDAVNLKAISEVTKTSADWLLRGFAAPAWRETYDKWSAKVQLEPRARIWLESLPLDGYEPSAAFYDLVHVAFKHGLSVAQALQMATENLDADRRNKLGGTPKKIR